MHGSVQCRVPTFTEKKSRTFPRLSRTPMKNFPGPFQSAQMLKYKEKRSLRPEVPRAGWCSSKFVGGDSEASPLPTS